MALSPIGPREIGLAAKSAEAAESASGDSFASKIQQVLEEANTHQTDAHKAIADLVVRGEGTLHDAMIAVQTAEGSFRLLMEMRNRLIDGVNRLLQTQV